MENGSGNGSKYPYLPDDSVVTVSAGRMPAAPAAPTVPLARPCAA